MDLVVACTDTLTYRTPAAIQDKMDQFIGTGRRIFGLAWDPSEVDVVNSSEVGEVTTSEVGVVNSRRWVWLHLS